jgi:hypothetical protein
MTKQIPDKFLYINQEFIIAGIKGRGLFKPVDFGILPEMKGIVTACYRGYFSSYECSEDKLFLIELSVIQNDQSNLPLIQGIAAKTENVLFSRYYNLRIPCSLSGGLIIVQNPIAPVGHFPSPVDFSEVIELIFERGSLQNEIDHSHKMKDLKQRIDELRKLNRPDNELLNTISLWGSAPDKLSSRERERLESYMHNAQHIQRLEWSFVDNYEQQPDVQK